ncbi:MAG: hypothetical protein ACREEJ_22980 [Ensifer adhaerens]
MNAKMVNHVPVFCWMLKEAAEGSGTAKVLFLINCMLIWLLAIIAFGYPAIIIPALALVPTVFVLLILITTG